MGNWKKPEEVAREVLDEAEARWTGALRHAVTTMEPDCTAEPECMTMVAELVALGWTRLGVALAPFLVDKRRAVLRILVSPDGRAVANVAWRIRKESLFFWKEQGATCEIVSGLGDGSMLVTLNGGRGQGRLPRPEGVAIATLRTEATARQIARLHACRVRHGMAEGRAAEPITMLADAIALFDEMLAREAALRRSFGFISTQEYAWRDTDPPHARAFESEKRRRRQERGGIEWRALPIADAIDRVLLARGRAGEESLPGLLDSFAGAGTSAAREAVARTGGADALLLHVYEQARHRGRTRDDWPSYASTVDYLRPRTDGLPSGVNEQAV